MGTSVRSSPSIVVRELEAQAAGKKNKKGFMTPERKKKLRLLLRKKAAEERAATKQSTNGQKSFSATVVISKFNLVSFCSNTMKCTLDNFMTTCKILGCLCFAL